MNAYDKRFRALESKIDSLADQVTRVQDHVSNHLPSSILDIKKRLVSLEELKQWEGWIRDILKPAALALASGLAALFLHRLSGMH